MKQQDQNSRPELYQELNAGFRMTQQQKDRVEQMILERANQKKNMTAPAADLHANPIRLRRNLLLPLAACLTLTVGSIIGVSYAMRQRNDLTISESSTPVEEQVQTETDVTETTTQPAETSADMTHTTTGKTQTTSQTAQTQTTANRNHSERTTETAAPQNTAQNTAQNAAQTDRNGGAHAAVTTRTTAAPSGGRQTTVTQTAASTASRRTTTARSTTVTTQTTVTQTVTDPVTTEAPAPVITTEAPPPAAEKVMLSVGNYTARPGDTVTFELRFAEDVRANSFQLMLDLQGAEGLPQAGFVPNEYDTECRNQFGSMTEVVVTGEHASVVNIALNPVQYSAGILIMRAKVQIPADAVPGSVYRLVLGSNQPSCFLSGDDADTHIYPYLDGGSITVTDSET